MTAEGWDKKHDNKNYRRVGERKGKKDRENFVKYRFINIKFILQSGWVFCPRGFGAGSVGLCALFKAYSLNFLLFLQA